MAIISDIEEEHEQEQTPKPSSSPSASSSPAKPFAASLDHSNPLQFLLKAFDFVAQETDFLEKPGAEPQILSALRTTKQRKEKRKAAEEKRLNEERKKLQTKEDKQEVKEEPVAEPKPKPEKAPMEVEKKEETGTRGTGHSLLSL